MRALLPLLGVLSLAAAEPVAAPAGAVAVIDLVHIVESCAVWHERAKGIDAEAARREAAQRALASEAEKLAGDMRMLRREDSRYVERQEAIEAISARWRYRAQRDQAETDRARAAAFTETAAAVRAQLTVFARERGLRLVLVTSAPGTAATLAAARAELAGTAVAYADPALDVTTAALAFIDVRLDRTASPTGR